jgi:hypothetical protein
VTPLISRVAWSFGAAVLTMALLPARAEALTCEARGVVELGRHHGRCAGSGMNRYSRLSEPNAGTVTVCADASDRPLGGCRAPVDVVVTLPDEPPHPSSIEGGRLAQNRARALEREVRAAAERRRHLPRPVMLYGIEPEPAGQFQLKREMLFLLARVSGQGLIGRAAVGLGPISSLRAVAESEALEGTRVRATYLQIEEFRGPNPLVNSLAVQGAYAAAGGALFWAGLLGEKLLHGALGDALAIHPQVWPPGIQIKGSFSSP